jgi:hypothetical protein
LTSITSAARLVGFVVLALQHDHRPISSPGRAELEIDASFYADNLILVVRIECIFDLSSERVLRPSLEHDYAVSAKCRLEWTRFEVQLRRHYTLGYLSPEEFERGRITKLSAEARPLQPTPATPEPQHG